jgi:small subunit ribosomal protein S6
MALYEHVFLARQDVSSQQVEAMIKEYQTILEGMGGSVPKQEYWGIKPLAYKVKKSRKAHFVLMNIDAPPAAVKEMERQMSIATDVLRFLTLRVEAHETEPSAMMRKSDRDDRGPRGPGGDRGDRGGGGGFRGGDRGGDRPGGGGGFRGPREDFRGPPRDRPAGDRPVGDAGGFRPRRDDAVGEASE